jgi:hypothetical protein
VHEPQIPVFRVVQVGEATLHERPHEIERKGCSLVATQQQLRIRSARLGGEFGPVHQIAPIGRQRHTLARLGVGRARLGVLARHAADTDDGLLEAVQEHETHLQKDLQLLGDDVRLTVGKRFCAVAPLKQKRLPALRGCQARAQRLDLPRHDDRGQARELRDDPLQGLWIAVERLLLRRPGLPAGAVPGSAFGRSHGIDPSM